ncbi:MAG: YezD family protein [Verrucomicrobiae bacterium]|nr:YezD family protein [Verrucomicrobiae bacterium]
MIQKKNTSLSWSDLVSHHVNSIRFGIVQVVVHDGEVVQVERTEKIRFNKLQNLNESTVKAEAKE